MSSLSRAHRRQRRARRVFVRPFLAADCRQDFDTLQGRLLDTFVPLGTVDTIAFEQTMTLLWKWNFRNDPKPRRRSRRNKPVLAQSPRYSDLVFSDITNLCLSR